MRQVPVFGLAGDGRVARHFRHYFSLLGLAVRCWSRRSSTTPPPEAFSDSTTVLLLLRDDAIVPFVEAWPTLRDKRLVHCSASLVTPVAEVAHPLMTFGPDLYDAETYRGIPFVLDAGGTRFADLLPGLPNPSFTLSAADRPYYHALCVLAGNLPALAWRKLFAELETRFGIPAAAAQPYLRRLAANLLADRESPPTGPLSRGDTATVAANLRALEGDPFHPLYSAMVAASRRPGGDR
jgi:predicted short-subunit dehydrogenase-like oxidoreductase (DUF2520 family)